MWERGVFSSVVVLSLSSQCLCWFASVQAKKFDGNTRRKQAIPQVVWHRKASLYWVLILYTFLNKNVYILDVWIILDNLCTTDSYLAIATISVKISGHIILEESFICILEHSCVYHTLNHWEDPRLPPPPFNVGINEQWINQWNHETAFSLGGGEGANRLT